MPHNIRITGDFHTTEDGFGYDKYANTILGLIREPDFPTPFTFGIFGEWGSGKTSLMRMVEEGLRAHNPDIIVPVWFNPWRYDKEEHLIVPFLKTIQQSIEQHIEENKSAAKKLSGAAIDKLKKLSGRLSKIAFAVFSSIGTEVELGGVGQKLKLKVDLAKGIEMAQKIEEKEELTDQLGDLREYSSAYYDIIRYLSEVAAEEPKGLRIVVFIDDLDRCLPEKAIELLEGIKTFLDIPGYVFLIGVDRSVIEKGVKVKYRGYVLEERVQGAGEAATLTDIPITPTDYLEKIVQVPITLPPIDRSRVEGYLMALIDKNEALKPYLDIIQLGLKQNPRTYKRFVNTLAFHTKLAVERGCLAKGKGKDDRQSDSAGEIDQEKPLMNLELLVKWTIINFAFTDLVTAMKRRKLLIVEIQDWIERVDEQRRHDGRAEQEERASDGLQIPSHIKVWLDDDRLVSVLRKNIGRGDTGFSKDNVDLYVKMGELTPAGVRIVLPPGEVTVTGGAEVSVRPSVGAMVAIPAGQFLCGDKKEKKSLAEYEIDVYPVTNTQFGAFMDAGGYEEKEFWSDQGWMWRQEQKITMPRYWEDDKWNQPNHPVVGVCFYEAEAFATWAGKRLPRNRWKRISMG